MGLSQLKFCPSRSTGIWQSDYCVLCIPQATQRLPPDLSQSISCCSLRTSIWPVAIALMLSTTAMVAKLQQQPHLDPLTCWFLMGPTMPACLQSTDSAGST